MKKKRKNTIISILPAVFPATMLVVLYIVVHAPALNPKTEAILHKSRKSAVNTEDPERKSGNELQYEKLLQEEQAILEEISRQQGSGPLLDDLTEELHRIQILKQVLEARMEAEKPDSRAP